ncbi:hypothetical protein, partial [Tolypothrix sp. VBCCA 56010]|uniref:hypothetical protein n=1 Tax=Tolypothrix sp. VBCCA 56010 TaxID=3137731 RepID=UPI003D7EAB69
MWRPRPWNVSTGLGGQVKQGDKANNSFFPMPNALRTAGAPLGPTPRPFGFGSPPSTGTAPVGGCLTALPPQCPSDGRCSTWSDTKTLRVRQSPIDGNRARRGLP